MKSKIFDINECRIVPNKNVSVIAIASRLRILNDLLYACGNEEKAVMLVAYEIDYIIDEIARNKNIVFT